MDSTRFLEGFCFEARVAATRQERQAEQLQLERLKLRVQEKIQRAKEREEEETAA